MKKNLLLFAAMAISLGVNAQTESAFLDPTVDVTTFEAGSVICSSENVTMKIAYADTYKSSALAGENDNAKSVTIDGVTYQATSGITGNTNPKATITAASTEGFVIRFDVKKDGYIYAIAKLSSNKPYYVWEGLAGEGEQLVAYTYQQHLLDETTALGPEISYTLPATAEGYFDANAADADKYTDGSALRWPEKIVLGADAEDVKKNGLGVISFPVYAEAGSYLLHATGSKITIDGFVFTTSPATVTIGEGGTEGIAAAIKADAQNGAIFNVAGQKVGANYKGLVIKNGKKTIQ